MAELTIRPEEIKDALSRFVSSYTPETASRTEVGRVLECGDGIARVEGLPSTMTNEILEFEGGLRGVALNLDLREIGTVLLGEFSHIRRARTSAGPATSCRPRSVTTSSAAWSMRWATRSTGSARSRPRGAARSSCRPRPSSSASR